MKMFLDTIGPRSARLARLPILEKIIKGNGVNMPFTKNIGQICQTGQTGQTGWTEVRVRRETGLLCLDSLLTNKDTAREAPLTVKSNSCSGETQTGTGACNVADSLPCRSESGPVYAA